MINFLEHRFFQRLKKLPFIEEIWLYGSQARGDATQSSDIDLAIVCPNATWENWLEVLAIIEQADTLKRIDCVRFEKLEENDPLRQNILRFKKVLYLKGTDFMDKELWIDYFNSLGDALDRLQEIIEDSKTTHHASYVSDAAIQRFEFCVELFWKVLKKILSYEKIDTTTPRDVLQKACAFGFIDDNNLWLKMLDDRNRTSHIYKESEALEIFERIKHYGPFMLKSYEFLKTKI